MKQELLAIDAENLYRNGAIEMRFYFRHQYFSAR